MRLFRATIAAALSIWPAVAFAQAGVPPSAQMKDGSYHSSVPSYNWCSNDSGVTWVPCPTPSGSGPGGTSFATSSQTYSAQQAGSGYAVGDVLVRVVTSTPPAGATAGTIGGAYWVNLTQGTVLSTAPTLSTLMQLPNNITITAQPAAYGSAGSLTPFLQGLGAATAASSNVFVGGQFSPLGVQQPDVFASGTIASGTANAAYTAAIANGAGVAGFTVTGLTVSGATLAIETSNDGGTTWSAANGAQGSTGILFSTVTADGQFRVNVGGRKAVRLRVAATGSGTINVTSNVSLASTEVGMSSPLPPGLNTIGTVNSPANGTPGATAPATAGQVAGVGPNGNLRAVATDTRGALQPAQVSYLDSTAVAVGTTAVQLDSDVTNSGTSVAMTTAQRGARIGITVQNAGAATTSDIFLCFGGQGANCSSTNYTYRLASGFGAGSLFLPVAAPGVPVYAIGAAASAGTIKVSSQVAL